MPFNGGIRSRTALVTIREICENKFALKLGWDARYQGWLFKSTEIWEDIPQIKCYVRVC